MSMNQPPNRRQECDTGKNNTVIIHRGRGNRQRIGEAEDDIEENYKGESQSVDSEAIFAHPERSLGHVFAAGEEMAADSEGVGRGAENNEGAYQIGERGLAADGDGAESGGHEAGENGGFDGAGEVFVNFGEEAREWRCVVAG